MNKKQIFENFCSDLVAKQNSELDQQFVKDFLFSLEKEDEICVKSQLLLDWKVFTQERNIYEKLKKNNYEENKDYTIFLRESTGGRPSKKYLLTVDCFKELCLMSCNDFGKKVRKYYLVLEKLFKKYIEEEFTKQLSEKEKKLDSKEEEIIKMKKSIKLVQKKFTYRYKFEVRPCLYILEDPNCKYGRYKFGITNNINERLASDRTMIPDIKIRGLFYTEYNVIFEQLVKIKYRDQLELPSHEWVYENLEKIINDLKEIDKISYFCSSMAKDLWRYNLEDKPKEKSTDEVLVNDSKPQKRKEPKNIPKTQNKFEEEYTKFLPNRLIRCEYKDKTDKAEFGKRFCNGYCQVYQSIESFTKQSNSYMTVCKPCVDLLHLAKSRVENEFCTEEEIRKNPSILSIEPDEMVCNKCFDVKKKSEFPDKRRHCKTCRNKNRSLYGKKFDDMIQDEIKTLETMSSKEIEEKLDTYIKDELQKLISYYKIGRKYNDTKQIMKDKLCQYLNNV